jgi:hypothetical protein
MTGPVDGVGLPVPALDAVWSGLGGAPVPGLGIEAWRVQAAGNVTRYRVGAMTRIVIVEGFVLRVYPNFQVAGVVQCFGMLRVAA